MDNDRGAFFSLRNARLIASRYKPYASASFRSPNPEYQRMFFRQPEKNLP